MNRKVLKDLNPETAAYVIVHAMLQKKNGRYHPTMVYKGEKNPEKALTLAKTDMGIKEIKIKRPKAFIIPEAENFTKYLLSVVGKEDVLTIDGPDVIDWNYDIKYGLSWIIFLNGEKLGEYRTFDPNPREKNKAKAYIGLIPGYVNEAIVIHNEGLEEEHKIPVNQVSLDYSNQKFEAGEFHHGQHGTIVKTRWKRQDRHKEIQFP